MLAALIRYAFTLTRPVLFLGAILVGLVLVSEPDTRAGALVPCPSITSNMQVNRALCALSPTRLFNGERKTLY